MAITLFVGGITEDKQAVYKRTFFTSRKIERTFKRGVEVRYVYVQEKMERRKMLKLLDARHYTIFVLVDENMNQKALLREDQLLTLLTK